MRKSRQSAEDILRYVWWTCLDWVAEGWAIEWKEAKYIGCILGLGTLDWEGLY